MIGIIYILSVVIYLTDAAVIIHKELPRCTGPECFVDLPEEHMNVVRILCVFLFHCL